MLVLLICPLILIINVLDLEGDLLNLVQPSIVHPLLESVLPDEFLDVDAGLLEVDLEDVNFLPEVKDGILVNVTFDPGIKR